MQKDCEEGNDLQLWKYVVDYKINTDISTISYIKEWLWSANEMQLNKTKHKGKDIRWFSIRKRKQKKKYDKEESENESEFEEECESK